MRIRRVVQNRPASSHARRVRSNHRKDCRPEGLSAWRCAYNRRRDRAVRRSHGHRLRLDSPSQNHRPDAGRHPHVVRRRLECHRRTRIQPPALRQTRPMKYRSVAWRRRRTDAANAGADGILGLHCRGHAAPVVAPKCAVRLRYRPAPKPRDWEPAMLPPRACLPEFPHPELLPATTVGPAPGSLGANSPALDRFSSASIGSP